MSSVTVVHQAKAVGRNEMPFGRDTRVVPSNTVLDRGPGPPREGTFGDRNPQLLWPLLSYVQARRFPLLSLLYSVYNVPTSSDYLSIYVFSKGTYPFSMPVNVYDMFILRL